MSVPEGRAREVGSLAVEAALTGEGFDGARQFVGLRIGTSSWGKCRGL